MRCTLNTQGIVDPTDKRFGASTTKLGFQLKLINVAAGPFSFRLNVLGGPDLPWPHNLVVIQRAGPVLLAKLLRLGQQRRRMHKPAAEFQN